MEQIRFMHVALFSAALAILAVPALALAQAAPASSGGFEWLILLVVAGLMVAIIWFTVSQRRGGAKNIP